MSALASVSLKKNNPSISAVLGIFTGVMIITAAVSYISPLINEINDMLQKTAASGKYAAVLIKTVGICGLCRFTSGSCRDMGENGLAAKVEFASKAAVAVMSLPLVEEIITTSLKLLGEQM